MMIPSARCKGLEVQDCAGAESEENRPLRIAESDPFPSLAASHRQSMTLANSGRGSGGSSTQARLSVIEKAGFGYEISH